MQLEIKLIWECRSTQTNAHTFKLTNAHTCKYIKAYPSSCILQENEEKITKSKAFIALLPIFISCLVHSHQNH